MLGRHDEMHGNDSLTRLFVCHDGPGKLRVMRLYKRDGTVKQTAENSF